MTVLQIQSAGTSGLLLRLLAYEDPDDLFFRFQLEWPIAIMCRVFDGFMARSNRGPPEAGGSRRLSQDPEPKRKHS
jgi:hypothetical protein